MDLWLLPIDEALASPAHLGHRSLTQPKSILPTIPGFIVAGLESAQVGCSK